MLALQDVDNPLFPNRPAMRATLGEFHFLLNRPVIRRFAKSLNKFRPGTSAICRFYRDGIHQDFGICRNQKSLSLYGLPFFGIVVTGRVIAVLVIAEIGIGVAETPNI